MLALITSEGATHIAIAFDTVIESFRNELFGGYKTGDGIEPELWAQFPLAERMAAALGFVVWPMVRFEADDALATGARLYAKDADRVLVCSPDKDLMQCVRGDHVISVDRRRKTTLDEAGVESKFGVKPSSIPDYLALVGDTADGIPGIPRWGAKTTAQILSVYKHLEQIPDSPNEWTVKVRGAQTLAANLAEQRADAELYRTLATLRVDVPLDEKIGDLEWAGAERQALSALAEELGDTRLIERVPRWR